MSKHLFSALAVSALGAAASAGTDAWASLDRELESLSASLAAEANGPRLGGFIITSFDWDDDNDIQGFQLRNARLKASGSIGDYGYLLSTDLASDVAEIVDAFATFRLGDSVTGRMGRFKPPTLSSFLVSRERLLFLERSAIGSSFERDLGLQLSGDFETVHWWLAAQNGQDGSADEFLFTARVAVDLFGAGVGDIEGAYGAPDGAAVTLAGFFQDDGSLENGSRAGAELRLTSGPFYASAEVVDNDVDIIDPVSGTGDNTPWSVTASFQFADIYEAAFRWEEWDDEDDSNRTSFSINRYMLGHDVKWTLQISTGDSDDPAKENDIISLGLTVSF